MKVSRVKPLILLLIPLSLSACDANTEKPRNRAHKTTVTTFPLRPVTLAQQYVCQIQSHHRIEVRTPGTGYVTAILIKEGQAVKRDDLLFRIAPALHGEKQDAENKDKEILIKAPFDGVIGRLLHEQGSAVRQGEALTTLSDDSQMWAYFNVPEAQYLEYKATNPDELEDDRKVELLLANGDKFDQVGKLGAISASFNAGSVAFRADFPNPDRRLRHGAIGTVLVNHVQKDAIVIPQLTTFEVLNKRYVYIVDGDSVVRRREIVIQSELGDDFVVKKGIGVKDKVVIEGNKWIRDGDKVKYEEQPPQKAIAELK